VSTDKGGSADVEVHLLSTGPDRSPRPVDPAGILDSDAFAKSVALYDTVVCVGRGSRGAALTPREIARLIDNRAIQLCGIIARKPYVSQNTRLYGLPLGQQLPGANAAGKERPEKSLVVIGIKSAKGDLAEAAVQKKMIAELVRGGSIQAFPAGSFSEAASGNELRYIEVKGGNVISKSKPVNATTVRPAPKATSAMRAEAGRQNHGLQRGKAGGAHHKQCGRHKHSRRIVATSKALPVASRGISRLQGETAGGEVRQHGCGIFDFPF